MTSRCHQHALPQCECCGDQAGLRRPNASSRKLQSLKSPRQHVTGRRLRSLPEGSLLRTISLRTLKPTVEPFSHLVRIVSADEVSSRANQRYTRSLNLASIRTSQRPALQVQLILPCGVDHTPWRTAHTPILNTMATTSISPFASVQIRYQRSPKQYGWQSNFLCTHIQYLSTQLPACYMTFILPVANTRWWCGSHSFSSNRLLKRRSPAF